MKTVLITGASHGIGAAIARKFSLAEDNARLILVSRTESKLNRVADECRRNGAEAVVLPADLTDVAAVAELGRKVLAAFGPPDVLVNNAGLFQPGMLADTDFALFKEQIDANLMSAFLVTKAFLNEMVARGSGDIFYMGSVASIRAYPGGAAYCAAKHGLLGLARVVRAETLEKGVRVMTLMPGATRTPSWEGTDQPEHRFMPPEDVAEALYAAHRLTGRSVVEEILIRPQRGDL